MNTTRIFVTLYAVLMDQAIQQDPSKVYQALGKTIAAYRADLGLSQATLAKQLGVAQQLVAAFEAGTRRISVEDLLRLSIIFKVPVATLFTDGQDSKKPGPRPKLVVAYEKLTQFSEKDQGVILAMIDSLSAKTKE